MSDIWFVSDLHLFHKNLLSFKNKDGSFLRPEFAPTDPNDEREVSRCLREHNNTLIENINKCVKPGDKLYNLGDTTFYLGEAFYTMYKRINTSQHRLLYGNHDDPNKLVSFGLFKKTGIWRVFKAENFTASHIPLDPRNNKLQFSLHGHTHCNNMLNVDGTEDLRYINICVEKTNYFPVNIDDVTATIAKRTALMASEPDKYPVTNAL